MILQEILITSNDYSSFQSLFKLKRHHYELSSQSKATILHQHDAAEMIRFDSPGKWHAYTAAGYTQGHQLPTRTLIMKNFL